MRMRTKQAERTCHPWRFLSSRDPGTSEQTPTIDGDSAPLPPLGASLGPPSLQAPRFETPSAGCVSGAVSPSTINWAMPTPSAVNDPARGTVHHRRQQTATKQRPAPERSTTQFHGRPWNPTSSPGLRQIVPNVLHPASKHPRIGPVPPRPEKGPSRSERRLLPQLDPEAQIASERVWCFSGRVAGQQAGKPFSVGCSQSERPCSRNNSTAPVGTINPNLADRDFIPSQPITKHTSRALQRWPTDPSPRPRTTQDIAELNPHTYQARARQS